MSKKTMLLALAAVSAAMFALPAAASAGEWEIHPENVGFTISSGPWITTASNGDTIQCTSTAGSGAYAGNTGGTMSLLFHGCKSSGIACTTPGLSAGTISAGASFTNVYLSEDKTTPGITFTGPSGTESTMASYKCAFGLVSITLHGSINAHLEGGCDEGKTSSTRSLEFASGENHGEVKWPYVTEDDSLTKDDLTYTRNGTPSTGSWDATWTLHYEQAAGVNCV